MSRSLRYLSNPFFRFVLAFITVLVVMNMLKAAWRGESGKDKQGPVGSGSGARGKERLAVAHFMLGNTYPYTETDWKTTLHLAEETGLDGLALNLGPEEWQFTQAKSAFQVLAGLSHASRLRLFLSLDCTVLPTSTVEDGQALQVKVRQLLDLGAQGYLHYRGEPLLSTFGGESASFGGQGWEGWLRGIGHEVFFMPAFFLPPEKFANLPYVDGMYAWNGAWPLTNRPNNLNEDEYFLEHKKPYMASISPLFFTHYGTTGQWAFNKNFIYRSDDLLYPTRWQNLLSLSPAHSPDIIQIISWNDYGESHYIAPPSGPGSGAQPGSEAWTKGMPHEAFREMTWYFIGRWRDRQPEVGGGALRVWMWYRPHTARMTITGDEVGRPDHADWAQDLINIMILAPKAKAQLNLHVHTGGQTQQMSLLSGQANTFTVPFRPGPVTFEVTADRGRAREKEIVLSGEGKEIVSQAEAYNFNMWTGSWRARIVDPKP